MGTKYHKKSKKLIKQTDSSEVTDKSINQKVLNLLYSENGMTVAEVMAHLNIEYALAKITLRELVGTYLAKYRTDGAAVTRYFCYEKEAEFDAAHPHPDHNAAPF